MSLEYPASLAIRVGMARDRRPSQHLIGDFTMDATSHNTNATLTVGRKTYDFPILSGTVGPDVIDIGKLDKLSLSRALTTKLAR